MDIEVAHDSGEAYAVTVKEDGSVRTSHTVTVAPDLLERYGGGATAEDLLRESFAFLLEREPPESILRSFTIDTIERYFPEYPREIRKRLGR